MKLLRQIVLFAVAAVSSAAWASGFGLYEPSAIGHAMGGALVGRAMDASANFWNPATLTDLTNIEVTVGFVTEHPRGTVAVRRNGSALGDYKMDPGFFCLPACMVAVPVSADFSFGLGLSAEYGLGTEYDVTWPMSWNCYETTVQGLVLNPNLAYRVTDDWSVAAGFRWLYFTFEQFKRMDMTHPMYGNMGHLDYHLKGDNRGRGFGWQIGTKYDILDNLSVGIVYKAEIDTTIRGDTTMQAKPSSSAFSPTLSSAAAPYNGGADADIKIPQSITGGVNWDPLEVWHLGLSVSWTEWSKFDTLVFNVKPESNPVYLNWRDTWRGSLASCWDVFDDWSWIVSYTYDMDSTRSDQASVMLPPASRHILSSGIVWRITGNWQCALSYSCIFMNGFDMTTTGRDSVTGQTSTYHLATEWGYCHAGGFSVTYRF